MLQIVYCAFETKIYLCYTSSSEPGPVCLRLHRFRLVCFAHMEAKIIRKWGSLPFRMETKRKHFTRKRDNLYNLAIPNGPFLKDHYCTDVV
jgi:hypothetical protein